jgi:lipopolysaccharide export LptBFGC system permease protein LptF
MFDTLSRYLLVHTGARFGLLFVIFAGVLVGGQFGLLIGRGVPPEATLPVLQGMLLFSLPFSLPIALSTALLVILGAMRQDGELRALAASGVGHQRVVVRLLPLVLAGVAVSVVFSHMVMPAAAANLRANMGRMAQSAIAERVASNEPALEQKNVTLWVGAADGAKLQQIHALQVEKNGELSALFAPSAHWANSERGIMLEAEHVQAVQRQADGNLLLLDLDHYDYLREEDAKSIGRAQADTLPTSAVWALAQQPPARGEDLSAYNNARLTLQFRLFLPVALVAFCLFAIGLGLAFGTAQNLPGVVIMVVTVALVTLPAFGYVKSNLRATQINPGFLLWPPALVVAALGLWLLWRPEHAHGALTAPLRWLEDRRPAKAP